MGLLNPSGGGLPHRQRDMLAISKPGTNKNSIVNIFTSYLFLIIICVKVCMMGWMEVPEVRMPDFSHRLCLLDS